MSPVRYCGFGPLLVGALLSGCVAGEAPGTPGGQERAASVLVAGWYSQNAEGAVFQPCGSAPLSVPASAALRQRAKEFGLQDDLPVYVRLRGTRGGNTFEVANIEQFGSPAPVRDCPMSGTTIQY